jgi:DNA processing protein
MNEEVFWHLALTQVPQIGDVHIGVLLSYFGSPSEVFKSNQKKLESLPGIGVARATAIKNFNGFNCIEQEIAFLSKNGIEPEHLSSTTKS